MVIGYSDGFSLSLFGMIDHMLRTRDFILFFAVVLFLLVAIFATVFRSFTKTEQPLSALPLQVDTTTATYTASTELPPDTKSERLAILRQKISERDPVLSAPEESVPEDAVIEADEEAAATSTEVAATTVDTCKTYRTKTIPGLTGSLMYAEENGSRVFRSNVTVFNVATSTGSSTTEQPSSVVFILPLRTTPLTFTSCIGTDIVAVTPTGAPIRNADYTKYQGMGEATLIGYTLDGFPLYGATSNLATDSCGGALIGGTYRYYLSDERKGVLGCFSGIPVAL